MKAYLDLVRRILSYGESRSDRTGVGTISLFGEQVRIDLRNGFPLLTTKKVALRWVAEELFWFLSGSTYEPDLRARGVDIWKAWATKEQCERFGRKEGDLGPIYGALWTRFGANEYVVGDQGVDQIERLLKDLVEKPASRRHLVTGWDPVTCDTVALPPCHTLWQCYVHNPDDEVGYRELSLHLYARSIDVFLGLPYNIASYALLLRMLAFVTGYGARELIISFGDVHLYKNHFNQAELQLTRDPRPLPELVITAPVEDRAPTLFSIRWDWISLLRYDPHPSIKAEVAV